jgi:hypothetical protein
MSKVRIRSKKSNSFTAVIGGVEVEIFRMRVRTSVPRNQIRQAVARVFAEKEKAIKA